MGFIALCIALGAPELHAETYRLPSNGLEVILSHDPTLPRVAVNVWYHAGPANEPPGQAGIAHLLERLMFRGSEHAPAGEHRRLLKRAGATDVDATTSFDRTNFYQTVPSHQLELALWLESDRMGFLRSSLSAQALDEQREVIRNERRQSILDRPYGRSSQALFRALFKKGHPYHGYVLGTAESLGALTPEDTRRYYDTFYAPANATLAVVGDFDPSRVKSLVETYFGSLPSRPGPKPRAIVTPPIVEEIRLQVPEAVELPRVQYGWHSAPALTQDDATAEVLAVILGQGSGSRLHRALLGKRALARSVYASQRSLQLASVFSVVVTAARETPVAQLEAAIENVLEALRRAPPSDEELFRAKNRLLTETVLSLEPTGARAERVNRYNHYGKSAEFLSQDLERYRKVSAADVHALARRLLSRNSRVSTITVPER